MPFKRSYRKRNNNRRRAFRKSRMPFTKKQTNIIKSLANKQTQKTREMKNMVVEMDEVIIPIGGQGVIASTTTANSYVLNYMGQGTGRAQRVGYQVNPVGFKLKGWSKINGTSSSPSAREIALRVCLGYVDNDTLQSIETGLSSTPIFWSNQATIPTGDYRDILRNFSWKAFQPVYDRTFKVRPNYTQADTDTAVPSGKDYHMININHKFGKSAELRLDNIHNDCWQKQNLVMVVFSRMLNDDTAITTLSHEFCLEGNMYYTDA